MVFHSIMIVASNHYVVDLVPWYSLEWLLSYIKCVDLDKDEVKQALSTFPLELREKSPHQLPGNILPGRGRYSRKSYSTIIRDKGKKKSRVKKF